MFSGIDTQKTLRLTFQSLSEHCHPDWAKVLEVLYRESPGEWDTENPEGHPFVEQTELEASEVDEELERLAGWGLVSGRKVAAQGAKIDRGQPTESVEKWELRQDGFEVAHDRETSKANNSTNERIAAFTLALVMVDAAGYAPLSKFDTGVSILLVLAFVTLVILSDSNGDFKRLGLRLYDLLPAVLRDGVSRFRNQIP